MDLKLDRVEYYFREISKIPRKSGNEKAISDYLVDFSKERNLTYIQDDHLNVIIKKPASSGYEDRPGIILQGHMDMVCEKTLDSDHDFSKDPISLIREGNILHADKTSLGADDGIAMAMALAVLERDDLSHPALEVLITSSEETDMSGALNLQAGILEGKKLINLDSEEDWILTVGSASGTGLSIEKKIEKIENKDDSYEFVIDGLLGGHSGSDIGKKRGNAIKAMASLLEFMKVLKVDYKLYKFEAGTADNAIPRSAVVGLNAKLDDKTIENLKNYIHDNYSYFDGKISLEVKKVDREEMSWTESLTKATVDLLNELPSGILRYNKEIDFIESSNNLAIVKSVEDKINMEISIRSSEDIYQKELVDKLTAILEKHDFSYTQSGGYPGWKYKEESDLRDLVKEIYKKETGKEYEVLVIHAGLECGAIFSKYPDLDIISIGPNIFEAHTPKEYMEIDSVELVYKILLKLLEESK